MRQASAVSIRRGMCTGVGVISAMALLAGAASAQPLRVVASTPDLGSLVRAIGGDQVAVTVLAKPTEDPHFVEAKPSYVKALSQADLFVTNGMEMEAGYAPVLLKAARNAALLAGSRGSVDASVVITPLDVPLLPVDRSMGDVHPFGSPHYLLDPVMGLKVAALLRDAMSAARPADAVLFAERFEQFRAQLGERLVGAALAKKYDAEKLATLAEYGKLLPFLLQQGDAALLGGWFGALAEFAGAKAVDDHPMWSYFARRFGLRIVGHLEPKPGVPPTTRHLRDIVDMMRAEHVRVILASAYYDPNHADFVAHATGATVARMANQVGARPGTDDYLAMMTYNVAQLVAALRGGG